MAMTGFEPVLLSTEVEISPHAFKFRASNNTNIIPPAIIHATNTPSISKPLI